MIKRNKTLLVPLNIVREPNTNLVLFRAILNKEYTRLDFGYIATEEFVAGGWIRISPQTYLRRQGDETRYTLTHADNIPIAPDHYHFQSTREQRLCPMFVTGRLTIIRQTSGESLGWSRSHLLRF